MRKRDHSLLANGASLLVCGLLAGLVVAAAAFPAVAMGGLAAKAGADTFDKLPTDLNVLPAPQITQVYASDGQTLLALLYDENRRDVSIADVAPVMQQALVASEDSRFYKHNGVDMKGVARAFVANQQTGAVSQGASTLTMQYVRQVISYTAKTPKQVVEATEDTPARKLREIKLALALEKKISKQQILELYLNIASFGHGAFGIFAASQVYFGKVPAELKLEEAALLAGLVQAPSAYDPADEEKRPLALERREYVLSQMVKMGYITQAQADEAQKVELKIVGKRTPEGCASILRPELGAGFFCDYLVRWWNSQEKLGSDGFDRENRLKSGGYRIVASLDINAQAAAKRNIDTLMQQGRRPAHEALMLAGVEPKTGRVQLLAVNRNFSNDQSNNGPNTEPNKRAQGVKGNYPNTSVPLLTGGGDIIGYQAGSVFKIFTIVAALERGLPLDYTINAVSPYKSKYPLDRSSPAACPDAPVYCPKNASQSMNGVRNMWTGLGLSVNTFFVPLQERAGAEKVVEVSKRLGLEYRAKGTPGAPSDFEFANDPRLSPSWGPFTLGVTSNTPLEMANAYATLAGDGIYCKPTPVVEILDLKGNKVDAANPQCEQRFSPDVARAAVDAARCPMGDQSAFGKCAGGTARAVRGIVGRPVSGKTGTTDDEKSATMIAMTPQIAVAGFHTDPDWPRTNQRFKHDQVNPAVAQTVRDAVKQRPVAQFTAPSRDMAFGKRASIPNVKCNSVEQARNKLQRAGFEVDVGSQRVGSDCPVGTVAKTDPEGSTVKAGVVVLVLSGGPGAPNPGGSGGAGGGGATDPRCQRFPRLCPPPRN
jgi:membrane peptidoglycan carboxypeptidase